MTTKEGHTRVTLTMQVKHVKQLEKLAKAIGTTKNKLATEVVTEFVINMQEVVKEIEGGKNIESATRSMMRMGLEALSRGLSDVDKIMEVKESKSGVKAKDRPQMAGQVGKR